MTDRLRETVEGRFKNAPATKQTVEIKEEILQNTIDRYNDLLAEGKSEQAAFNIAVAGIGDVEGLIEGLKTATNSPYTREEIEKDRNRNALLLVVAVAMYIMSPIPAILLSNTTFNDTLGPALLFALIAVATGILIYRAKTKLIYIKSDETVVEDFKEWNFQRKQDNSLMGAIIGAGWAVILAVYFLISFATGAWYVTWLIFPIGGAVTNIIRACFDLKK